MKNVSITTYINIIFIIAFAAITTTFFVFIKLDQEKSDKERTQRYSIIANGFLSRFEFLPTQEHLRRLHDQFEVEPVENRKRKLFIINNAKELMSQSSTFGRVRVYKDDKKYYIYVQKLSYNLLLKDLKPQPYNRSIALLVFILAFTVFMILYISIRRKFIPLKHLDKQIQKFSNGDKTVKLNFENNDEIGKIAKSFDNAITNINNLTESKNLFMRNMMHELKTPITKAMFIAETLPDNENRQILQRAFERMNNIIKELATVEKLSSNMPVIYKEKTNFLNIYQNTMNIMMIDAASINTKIHDFKLKVDISLFSITLKNLIDNAIKFSPDKHAMLIANTREIEIISKGKILKHDLDYYTEPFSQEEKRSDGFGLGLYIIKSTLVLHGYELKYKHRDGKNYFIIDMAKKPHLNL